MRWKKDECDQYCEAWAAQRRKVLGLGEVQPRDRIGKLSCTLGAVREEGEGASQGTVNQSFPEVYTGDALLVNRAWKGMKPEWRYVIEAHYVFAGPVKWKANQLEMSPSAYFKFLTFAKSHIYSFVMISQEMRSDAHLSLRTQNTAVGA